MPGYRISGVDNDRAVGADAARDEVRAWWTDLVEGRRSRLEAARWAEHRLAAGAVGDEELVTQALLFLQAVDLIHDGRRGESAVRYSRSQQASFLTSDPEVATALAGWIEELRRYDLNPHAWNAAYLVNLIADFAARHGADRAWHFADKLIASGHLEVAAVEGSLGRRSVAQESERADGPA